MVTADGEEIGGVVGGAVGTRAPYNGDGSIDGANVASLQGP